MPICTPASTCPWRHTDDRIGMPIDLELCIRMPIRLEPHTTLHAHTLTCTCACVKFRMGVGHKFSMGAKVTECARAARRRGPPLSLSLFLSLSHAHTHTNRFGDAVQTSNASAAHAQTLLHHDCSTVAQDAKHRPAPARFEHNLGVYQPPFHQH